MGQTEKTNRPAAPERPARSDRKYEMEKDKRILPGAHCDLHFDDTVTRWDEAIPLGNGQMGALIWGPSDGLRFSLDRGDIWDTTPYPGIDSEEFTYSNMVQLAKEGKVDEIRRIFDGPYNHPLPTKLPAGKLIFDLGKGQNVVSHLELARAEARLTIGGTRLCCFLSAESKAGFLKLDKAPEEFRFHIENPPFSIKGEGGQADAVTNSVQTSSISLLAYEKPEICDDGDVRWFVQKIRNDFSYGIFARQKRTSAGTEIAFYAASSRDGADWKERTLRLLDEALSEGYDKAFEAHCAWWAGFWQQSSVTLPDKLFEARWYLTQYYLGCCSRKGFYPMPLQGLWTADDGLLPPWKGDYHLDLNIQLTYYSYLKANHLAEGECFLDYLWDMRECAQNFARSFYNAGGLCLPSTMTITGVPLGGWAMYSFSPTNQLWLCQLFERHYHFTGDEKFGRERAYPYLKGTAEFILSLLEERDGFLYLPVSSSPEIHDDELEAFVTPNSNYDLALMRYLFWALEQLSAELGTGEEARWSGVLSKLPELAVNKDKVLMISPDECLTESHRHFSHAMGIHPLRLLDPDDTAQREIIDATIHDLEKLGTEYWVGFSFTWMAELYAIQGRGNAAAEKLRQLWLYICSQNGFCLNGDYQDHGLTSFKYRPFTLETNFCAADALQEMLVRSEGGRLELFPAIPTSWQKERTGFGSFLAGDGLRVSAECEKGEITRLVLDPCKDTCVRLKADQGLQALFAGTGAVCENGWLVLSLTGGKPLVLTAGQ